MISKCVWKFRRFINPLIHALILVALLSMFPVLASAKSLCDGGDQFSAIRGDGLCLVITTFNADTKRDYQPTLVVMLHGDVSRGGPAKYHVPLMLEVAQNDRIISVAMVRPGYSGGKGRKSEGSNYGRRDSYTKRNITAVGEAITNLRMLHNANRVVLIGHSGGAAMAGVIIGKVPLSTEVMVIVGKKDRNTRPRLSIDYVASLKKRNIKAKLSILEFGEHNFNSVLPHTVLWEAH